jgi:glycosyltransferase involved in cell wall biosynthesis
VEDQTSLIIPARNEAVSIGAVVAAARAGCPRLAEIVVVDDGSTDGTADAAREAGARVVSLSPNRGKGVALRTGVAAAAGAVLAFIDADGQDDARELPRLLEALRPDVDMVIGSRFLGTIAPGAITPLHRAGNIALTWWFNQLFDASLSDTQAGFRVVRRDALLLDALRASRYEIETELTAHVLRRGGRVVEVPVSRAPRAGGATGFETARDGLRILRTMTRERLRAAPRPGLQSQRP